MSPKKLLDVGFTFKEDDEETKDFVSKHEMYPKKKIVIEGNIRPMEKKDIEKVLTLFNNQQENCIIKYKMSKDELRHQLLNDSGVVNSYVVEGADLDDPLKPVVTDFFSITTIETKTVSKEVQMHDSIK